MRRTARALRFGRAFPKWGKIKQFFNRRVVGNVPRKYQIVDLFDFEIMGDRVVLPPADRDHHHLELKI